jgi:hypothetical protein
MLTNYILIGHRDVWHDFDKNNQKIAKNIAKIIDFLRICCFSKIVITENEFFSSLTLKKYDNNIYF